MRISFTTYKILLLLVVGIIFAVLVLVYSDDEGEEQAQVQSHLGTEVDISSDRDTFEYFLSTLGEQNLAQLNESYAEFSATLSFGERQKVLFEKYQAYRQSLALITPPQSLSGIDYLQYIHLQSLLMQSEHFSEEEQKRLFYEQNLTRELAIKRLEIALLGLDEDSYQAQWQAELDQLTPDMKESYENAALVGQLNRVFSLDDTTKSEQIRNLVGEEAAIRLEALEAEEAAFKQTFEQYLVERGDILQQSSASRYEQDQALAALRQTHFSPEDIRRVEALEIINDQDN
ncbi:lipase secretion chaperone [Enterovibrio calviensis]|uniref:lipase secretion chaperone n=1 Tax=Enterovibrio calviensis TaxID=91359 RepID=UPI000482695B|nr:lipase secretion chaperone [Enterovibrio calviensis]